MHSCIIYDQHVSRTHVVDKAQRKNVVAYKLEKYDDDNIFMMHSISYVIIDVECKKYISFFIFFMF